MIQKFGIVLFDSIKPKGGPSGYLYNLQKGFNYIHKNVDIYYYDENQISVKKMSIRERVIHNLSKYVRSIYPLLFIVEILILIKLALFVLLSKKNRIFERALSKKALHFHSVFDLFMFRKKYGYKGFTILTPHSPEPFYQEVVKGYQVRWQTKYKFPLVSVIYSYIERFAYKSANSYIFPCSQTKELYDSFPGFLTGTKGKPVKYVLSGTSYTMPTIQKDIFRKECGLDQDDFIIVYIGRHIPIKGYDLLIEAFEDLKKLGIKILCAGSLNSLYPPPKDKNWIELGWRNDPYNIINAADLAVLPNRSTYYDLIALEILAQGRLLVASDTGGNIELAKHTSGVVLFENGNREDFVRKIEELRFLNSEKRLQLEQQNRKFYEEFCTPEKFSSFYLEAINELTKDL